MKIKTEKSTEFYLLNHLEEFIKSVVKKEFPLPPTPSIQVIIGEWLTNKEAATYLRVSTSTLWDMCNRGIITKHYLDSKPRFKRSELDNAFWAISKNRKEAA